MPHSIEVWRAIISTARNLLQLAKGAGEELPTSEEDLVLAELCRKYPGLSRDVAEYLAR